MERSLKADALSAIPVVGAIFGWKAYQKEPIISGNTTSEKIRSLFDNTDKVAHVVEYMFGTAQSLIQIPFYPISVFKEKIGNVWSRENLMFYGGERVKIPVASRENQEIEGIFLKSKNGDPTGPTVVLFHGNGMTADDMVMPIGVWYREQGYNVLIPTMGGYPGSPGVKTSEISSYQDVEAVKKYLDNRGITEAGYHGLSIGGSLATQAAVGDTEAKVKTKFIILDQTFTNAEAVASNTNGALGKGAAKAAFPKRKAWISPTLQVQTDGLDNASKVKKIKQQNIPMFTIGAECDRVMGRDFVRGRARDGFANDLNKIRYETDEERQNHSSIINGGEHCFPFSCNITTKQKVANFLQETRRVSL